MITKRVLATILWFVAGWYVGAFGAFVLEISPALGPVLGTAAAVIVFRDPRGTIWMASGSRKSGNPAATNWARATRRFDPPNLR